MSHNQNSANVFFGATFSPDLIKIIKDNPLSFDPELIRRLLDHKADCHIDAVSGRAFPACFYVDFRVLYSDKEGKEGEQIFRYLDKIQGRVPDIAACIRKLAEERPDGKIGLDSFIESHKATLKKRAKEAEEAKIAQKNNDQARKTMESIFK